MLCILTMSSPHLVDFQGFFRKRKTSNLEAYINWFNRLSYLVATEICMVRSSLKEPFRNGVGCERSLLYTHQSFCFFNVLHCARVLSFQPVKKKHRARIIEFFIDVAQECFNIGNFNSLMAIISEYLTETSLFTSGKVFSGELSELWFPQLLC